MAMTLITTTNITFDGVAQGLGGPDEDRRGGFDRGGWAPPLADFDVGEYLDHLYPSAAAFLFGRGTYEIFAGSWGTIADMKTTPIGAALNDRPKCLVSTSLTNPQWADTTVLQGDLATAVRDQKAQNDGKLVVIGFEAQRSNPALEPLTTLVGTWCTTGTHPFFPGVVFGRTSFAWHEGGAFLLMRSEIDEPQIPRGVAIIGSDDGAGTFTMTSDTTSGAVTSDTVTGSKRVEAST